MGSGVAVNGFLLSFENILFMDGVTGQVEEKSKLNLLIPAIAIFSLISLFVWQMGIFNFGSMGITATGYTSIQPQLVGIGLDGVGNFTGVYTNGVGMNITLKEFRLIDTLGSGRACTVSLENKVVTATPTSKSNPENVSQAGEARYSLSEPK